MILPIILVALVKTIIFGQTNIYLRDGELASLHGVKGSSMLL